MDPTDRIVLFSERIETLLWLKAQLPAALGLPPALFDILHGGMSDTEQQDLVDRFGRKDDPIRMLLCSDVASEGLNLHYFCHRLVHFDLPWSLMVFQQRNGRVDRYGQNRQPRITYLFTTTGIPKIQGDLRILEILQAKDDQANKNLGDPACFLNVHDPELESLKVSEAMAEAPPSIQSSRKAMRLFVTIGWVIYPVGFLMALNGGNGESWREVCYNVADVINKVFFGLVCYQGVKALGDGQRA